MPANTSLTSLALVLGRQLVPVNASICSRTLPAAEAVALSPDAGLLACARGGTVDVYLVHALVAGQSSQPLTTWSLPERAVLRQARPGTRRGCL